MENQDFSELLQYGRHEDYLALIGLLPSSAKEDIQKSIEDKEKDRIRREKAFQKEIETYNQGERTKEGDDLHLSLLTQHIQSLDDAIQIAIEQERVFSDTLLQCRQYTGAKKDQQFCKNYSELAEQVYENASEKVKNCEVVLKSLVAKNALESRLSAPLLTITRRTPYETTIEEIGDVGGAGEKRKEEEAVELPFEAVPETAIKVGQVEIVPEAVMEERKRRAKIALATAIQTQAQAKKTIAK